MLFGTHPNNKMKFENSDIVHESRTRDIKENYCLALIRTTECNNNRFSPLRRKISRDISVRVIFCNMWLIIVALLFVNIFCIFVFCTFSDLWMVIRCYGNMIIWYFCKWWWWWGGYNDYNDRMIWWYDDMVNKW